MNNNYSKGRVDQLDGVGKKGYGKLRPAFISCK